MNSHGSTATAGLRLYLDSALEQDWNRFLPTGVFFGVTTNPLLLERAKLPCTLGQLKELAQRAVNLGVGEIHLQTWGESVDLMVERGQQLQENSSLGVDVAIKVPATAEGFRAAARLRDLGCRVTITAVYSARQVLLAAGLGTPYAAPYLGRINDLGRDGRQEILAMNQILKNTGSSTRLLVASLRTGSEVLELARQGLDTLTFGAEVAQELFTDSDTEKAAQGFLRSALTPPGW